MGGMTTANLSKRLFEGGMPHGQHKTISGNIRRSLIIRL